MYAAGFSLNLLTILAIVLSVGLVVDDAIVVVENVERHVREGKGRIDAALIGARELVGPIIAMTITPGGGLYPDRLSRAASPDRCSSSSPSPSRRRS
jgi:multidrug efflux pump